jgi:hypothetical protein
MEPNQPALLTRLGGGLRRPGPLQRTIRRRVQSPPPETVPGLLERGPFSENSQTHGGAGALRLFTTSAVVVKWVPTGSPTCKHTTTGESSVARVVARPCGPDRVDCDLFSRGK